MKLATYAPIGAQAPQPGIGAVIREDILDLNYAYARYLRDAEGEMRAYELACGRIPRDMIGFLQGGERAIAAATRTIEFVKEKPRNELTGISGERLVYPLSDVRLLAPIARPGKILAAGKNYAEHAKATAQSSATIAGLPPFPRGFVKVSSVIIGPDEPVEIAHVT